MCPPAGAEEWVKSSMINELAVREEKRMKHVTGYLWAGQGAGVTTRAGVGFGRGPAVRVGICALLTRVPGSNTWHPKSTLTVTVCGETSFYFPPSWSFILAAKYPNVCFSIFVINHEYQIKRHRVMFMYNQQESFWVFCYCVPVSRRKTEKYYTIQYLLEFVYLVWNTSEQQNIAISMLDTQKLWKKKKKNNKPHILSQRIYRQFLKVSF